MLRAYFDESGIHDASEVIVIGGLIADVQVWESFFFEWRKVLLRYDVPWFHASECEAGEGSFFGKLRDGALRTRALLDFAQVIGDHDVTCVSVQLYRKAWEIGLVDKLKEHFKTPYNLEFQFLMQRVCAWSRKNRAGDNIAMIFSEQPEYQDYGRLMSEWYLANKAATKCSEIYSLTFASPRQVEGLQAADLVAREAYLYALRPRQLRPAMGLIANAKKRFIGGFLTIESMREMSSRQDNPDATLTRTASVQKALDAFSARKKMKRLRPPSS